MSYTRYLAGFSCALSVGLFILSSEMSGSNAWSAVNAAPHNVNRSLKSDRLPLVTVINSTVVIRKNGINDQLSSAVVPELLEGCESVISQIGKPPLANVAGRCLS